MARKRRVLREGMMYHVMGRGNERKRIFEDDEDRELFLEVLSAGLKRYEGVCHAWCLMGNHYHLMIETLLPNLSELMRWIGTTYTVRYNRKRGRVGHLFQGRYRAEVVDKESYTKRLILYIHMNPVRKKRGVKKVQKTYVGGLKELRGYEWSSHLGYLGEGMQKREGFELSRRKYWKSEKDYEREVGWELANRANLNFREEARAGIAIGGDGFQRSIESHLAQQEGEAQGISKRLQLSRRQKEVEKLWRAEKEKKWQIWIRYEYGKESKASLAREYGYASGSGVRDVIERIQEKCNKQSEAEYNKRLKSYEKHIKNC
jgi:REP element-mobilizing transposase RayT